MPGKDNHRWRFYRLGGFDQVRLDTAEDLLALEQLDQKLWVAVACPIDGLELDRKTLELIDTDKDGRIRAPELIAAIKWAGSVLKSPDCLVKGSSKLALSDINLQSDEGKTLHAAAKQILKNLGKKGASEISIEDTADPIKIFAGSKFNGDGIITPFSAGDDAVKKTIDDIIAVMGPEKDRSGDDGVHQEKVDKFFAELAAFDAWWRAAPADAETLRPLGEPIEAAAGTFRAVQAKIDDYFTRTRLAAFDDRASGPMNRDPSEYAALASKMLSDGMDELKAFPLSRIEPSRPLPLDAGLNPAWAAAIQKLRREIIAPLAGEITSLTEAEWMKISARFSAFEAWHGQKAGASVEKLGIARVRELLAGDHRDKINDLIAKDRALEPEVAAIASVDRLLHYQRDLHRLANNFVSFRDFYGRKKATFQLGTLYLDGRSCDLCVKVSDPAAHAALAAKSGIYLVYCDLNRKGTDEKMTIAAAFTKGDSEDLLVGRNGIFYDRKGQDWDATIVKIIEQPISVRQAFWLPYKRVGRMIGEQIEQFAAERDKAVEDQGKAGVTDTGAALDKTAPGEPATPFDVGKFAGIFAAIGLAIGAIGSMLVAVVSGFVALRWWQMPLVVGGLVLLISLPSMLLAYLKLRRRNIGPVLDANGWAVNARARLNVPFGASLTQVAHLPEGAERSLDDPFEDKRRAWWLYILFVAIIGVVVYGYSTGQLKTWMKELTPAPPAASGVPAASGAPAPSGTAK